MWRRRIGGRKRRGRGGVALALALAMFLAAPALADEVPPGWEQWDYWGRSRPLPVYRLVWSGDDGLCKRIAKALNAAGPWPASLYGDPIFLRWRDYAEWPQPNPPALFPVLAKWMEVPFFNDGKPVIPFKLVVPSSRFVDEHLFLFDNVQYFRTFKPAPIPDLWHDPHLLRPFEPFMGKRFDSFVALPKATNDYERWSRKTFGYDVEINIAELSDKIYSVIRTPSSEAILVLLFSADHMGHAVCVIGAKRRR